MIQELYLIHPKPGILKEQSVFAKKDLFSPFSVIVSYL